MAPLDFSWFRGPADLGIASLVAKKQYGRAIKVLREQLESDPANPVTRQHLADVLVLDGRVAEAVGLLDALSDEYARTGHAPKAIALLKKIQRLDRNRLDIEERLTRLLREREAEGREQDRLRQLEAELGHGFEAPPQESLPEREIVIHYGFEADLEVPEHLKEAPPSPRAGEPGVAPPPPAVHPGPAPTPVDAAAASPLFGDFTADELVAVIRGLRLHSYEPGDVIVTEGETTDALFVIATGLVKAFVKDPKGRSRMVRTMADGAFFGEVSLLTGKPRTATVTAATHCELLELDRARLETIAASHPRVRSVLESFARLRAQSAAEAAIRRGVPSA